MGSIRRKSGLALLGIGFLFLVFGVMGALLREDSGPADWIFGVVSPFVLFLLPGWLLVRSGVKAQERVLAEEGSPAAGEEIARSSGSLRKWGGLALMGMAFFGILGAVAVLASGDQLLAGVVVLAGSLGLLAYPGWRLIQAGERLIHESRGEERAAAVRAEVAELDPAARSALGGLAEGVDPSRMASLAVLLRKGGIPADPRVAGLACGVCGVETELRKVELTKNTGALVVRYHQVVEGRLCRRCIERIAKEFTKHNLAFGWWGIISFFVNLGVIPANLVQLKAARGLALAPEGAQPPRLDPGALERLRPASVVIVDLLVAGKPPGEVYAATAKRVGVTPGQVVLFAAAMAAEGA